MRKITIKNDSAVALLPSHRRGPGSLNEKLLSTAKVRTPFEIASVRAEKFESTHNFFLPLALTPPFVTDKCYFYNPSSINIGAMSKVILCVRHKFPFLIMFALSKSSWGASQSKITVLILLYCIRHPRVPLRESYATLGGMRREQSRRHAVYVWLVTLKNR